MVEPGDEPGPRLRLFGEQRVRAQDEVAGVEHPHVAQHGVVRPVDRREFALLLRRLPIGERRRPFRVLLDRDELGLEPVDALDERRQQRGRVALEVVAAQRQLVDALEEQREPVRPAGRRREWIESGGRRLAAQQAGAQLGHGGHGQLLVRALDDSLHAGAQRGRGAGSGGQQRDPLGRDALLDQPPEPRDQRAGLAGPRPAEQQQWPIGVHGSLALCVGQAVERIGHHPRI